MRSCHEMGGISIKPFYSSDRMKGQSSKLDKQGEPVTREWSKDLMASSVDTNQILWCPSCDVQAMVTAQTEHEVEHFGSVLLNVATCRECGYRHSDVLTPAGKRPVALSAKIRSTDDLRIRVIKSRTATVSIPEFGVTVTPGPNSDGYITNVEGILEKVEDALTVMLASATGKRLKKGMSILQRLRTAMDEPRFTLVIKDPLGSSALVSPRPQAITERKLTRRELLGVKFGQYAL